MSQATAAYRISEVSEITGLSVDTLRYYEKIALLPKVRRTSSGLRSYTDRDLSRLSFIQRAQTMNFSLAEIAALLRMRDAPQTVREEVRELTAAKLAEIDARLQQLNTLRRELQLLLNLCRGSEEGCPIIEGIADAEWTSR